MNGTATLKLGAKRKRDGRSETSHVDRVASHRLNLFMNRNIRMYFTLSTTRSIARANPPLLDFGSTGLCEFSARKLAQCSQCRGDKSILEKRLYSGLRAAEDQGVDVVRALIGVHRLQVRAARASRGYSSEMPLPPCMSRAMPRDIERLAAIVALHQRDRSPARPCPPPEPAEPQRALQAERDFGLHVGELLLDQLVGGERTAELLAVEHILARACQQNSAAPIAPQAMP